MSIVAPETPEPNEVIPDEIDEILHFDYPGSDTVLRSCDSLDFRVPQLYIVNSSPVLRELIRGVPSTFDIANREEPEPLPVVKLPEIGTTLYSLLTFIFPVAPVLPSTTERIMELLAVAQKYQMDSALTYIRAVSRQDQPFIRPETAFRHYFLAQKHGLHQEALQAARVTLRLSMTIKDLEDELDFPGMSGAYLHELWKYHKQVRTELKSGLLEFRNSELPDDLKALRCTPPRPPNHSFPRWLDDYIVSITEAPHLFDPIEFDNVRARHIKGTHRSATCSCVDISAQVIRAFWDSLTTVVHRAIEKADPSLALVKGEPTSENSDSPPVPLRFDMPDASIIFRSSDQANFRVHKSVLAMSSPFFNDLLSLPQPPGDELIDGLPVILLSEGAGLLNSLISMLYPISPVIPGSYEEVFALLAACKKYDMISVKNNIRTEIKRGAFPAPVGAEAFSAYAIASSMGLIPEMENAARLTLGHPMTFEFLGEGLRSFKGQALCDLVRYRKRCLDNLASCLDTFFNVPSRCQIWASCRDLSSGGAEPTPTEFGGAPTGWLRDVFSRKSVELQNGFTHAIFSPSAILEEYLVALLKNHTHCKPCIRVHAAMGKTFCRELEDELARALDEATLNPNSSQL